MRCAQWTLGALINVIELQLSVLATIGTCIACLFGCWLVAAYFFNPDATLPKSAPLRVPIAIAVAILGTTFSLFVTYYVVLRVAIWPTRSFARMKRRCHTCLLQDNATTSQNRPAAP